MRTQQRARGCRSFAHQRGSRGKVLADNSLVEAALELPELCVHIQAPRLLSSLWLLHRAAVHSRPGGPRRAQALRAWPGGQQRPAMAGRAGRGANAAGCMRWRACAARCTCKWRRKHARSAPPREQHWRALRCVVFVAASCPTNYPNRGHVDGHRTRTRHAALAGASAAACASLGRRWGRPLGTEYKAPARPLPGPCECCRRPVQAHGGTSAACMHAARPLGALSSFEAARSARRAPPMPTSLRPRAPSRAEPVPRLHAFSWPQG